MPVEDFIIYVYCRVDDIYRGIVSQPLRGRGFMPKLSDTEAITMEIVGEFMGKDSDKGIWRYFRNHWHGCFPNLGMPLPPRMWTNAMCRPGWLSACTGC